jgi:hypothetical protein
LNSQHLGVDGGELIYISDGEIAQAVLHVRLGALRLST